MSLLLLFSSGWGTLVWAGPHPQRTFSVEPEERRVTVV